MLIKTNCRYYYGDKPCRYHKSDNIQCSNCSYYEELKQRILIIKLGSLGDVIRTTPLLRRLRNMFPRAEISWVTYCPEILPVSYVDNILEVNLENTTWLMANSFDWLINLDKDRFAIALAKLIAAKRKSGFGIDKFGKCTPFTNKRAKDKWLTGIDDELSKQNTKNYLEEIFGICGFDFQNEEYIIEAEPKSPYSWPIDYSRRVIGLNNGSGPLWRARLWPEQHWIELAKQLKNDGYEVLLLGGEQEYDKNTEIAHLSGVKYFGHFNIKKFIDLVNHTTLLKITNRGIYP